jgi:hypothetical protein
VTASRTTISRDEALGLYLRLGGRRSLSRLHRQITELAPGEVVSLRTLKEWSRRCGWARRAAEFDTDAAQRLVERAKNDIVDEQFDRIRGLQHVVQRCLEAALAIDLDPARGTPGDLRVLTMTAIDAIRAVEVLIGQGGRGEQRAAGMAAEAVMLLRQLEEKRRPAK